MSEDRKASMNVYREARLKAAKYNDKLSSREGAAELLYVHPSTIATYELDTVKNPSVDMVVMMADLYNAPELENYHCTHECPIGKKNFEKLGVKCVDRLTIETLSATKNIEEIERILLEITADGIIDDSEREQFEYVLSILRNLQTKYQEFEIFYKKQFGDI